MSAGDELVPFAVARALALDAVRPLGAERVALDAALGRTPVAPLVAGDDLVPFARSAMDGYAVRAADVVPGRALPIAARVVAGDPIATHRTGSATAIATGAALPLGADAVLPWEDVTLLDERIVPSCVCESGDHLFPPGDDARRGDVLAEAGEPLEAGTLALLAAAGHAEIAVRRRARVRILCTGDELVDVAERPAPGRVRESNGVLLRALACGRGADVVDVARAGDDPAALALALRRALRDVDVLITTGGASHGPRDGVKPALDAAGARFFFRSVAVRPAKPVALARAGDAIVAVLPGNPSAAFVAFHLFVAPLLDALAGRDPEPDAVTAALAGTVHAKAERTYAVHVRVVADAGRLVAEVLENQCSSLVGNAARANGLALLPPGARAYGDGDPVPVRLVAPLMPRRETPALERTSAM